jgi:hypothetical protein
MATPDVWPRGVIEEVRFAIDSPLEGGGFEPSVPLLRMAPRPASAELWEVPRRHEQAVYFTLNGRQTNIDRERPPQLSLLTL